MPTAEKEKTIQQAKDWYAKASGVVFTDYKGLHVKEFQGLRADLRKKGAEFHVLKNTLFRLAAGSDTAKLTDDLHNGTTAFAFVFENESDVAKAIFDYARVNKKLIVKGGFFGGKALNAKQVEELSQLPPRDVLIAQVIGAIAAPLSGLVGVIEALYADPIRTIGAVADKVAEGNPVTAETAAEVAPVDPPVAEADAIAEAASQTVETSTAEPAAEAAPVIETVPVTEAPEAETAPEAEAPSADSSPESEAVVAPEEPAAEAAPLAVEAQVAEPTPEAEAAPETPPELTPETPAE